MRLLSHLRKWKRQSSWSISSCSCLFFMQLPFLHAAAFSSYSCLLFMQLPSLHTAAFSSYSCLFFMQLSFLHAAAFSSCSCLFFMQLPSHFQLSLQSSMITWWVSYCWHSAHAHRGHVQVIYMWLITCCFLLCLISYQMSKFSRLPPWCSLTGQGFIITDMLLLTVTSQHI